MLAIEVLGGNCPDNIKNLDITGVAYDSRKVSEGNVFVCIKGYETDGHKYAAQAAQSGASLIIAEEKV